MKDSAAILLAAGRGSRMDGAVDDKILAPLGGRPVFAHSLDAFVAAEIVGRFVVVYRDAAQRAELERAFAASDARAVPVRWVRGGRERQDSVGNALRTLPASIAFVFIHDCARPLVRADALKAVAAAVRETGAACLAHRVIDTIKRAPAGGTDAQAQRLTTVDRARLRAMETPQAFRREWIAAAYDEVRRRKLNVTDDAGALERTSRRAVTLIENTHPNPKITRPADLAYAAFLLEGGSAHRARDMPDETTDPPFRIGHGYDIHRTAPGRRLVLGGVEFKAPFGLEGHSDADCLTHAICDALLGAAGLPDIGHFFPNTDPAYRDIDSQILLERTAAALRERGYRVLNVDASLIAEKPKIAARLSEMRARLAQSIGIDASQIGVKATTNEGSDDIGAGRAIAAHAACLIARR